MFQAVLRPRGAFQAACHASCSSVRPPHGSLPCPAVPLHIFSLRALASIYSAGQQSPATHYFARLRVAAGCGRHACAASASLWPLKRLPCVSCATLHGIGFYKIYQCLSFRSTHSQPPSSRMELPVCHPCSARRRLALPHSATASYRPACLSGCDHSPAMPLHSPHPPVSRFCSRLFLPAWPIECFR